jgi:hypothetical protein
MPYPALILWLRQLKGKPDFPGRNVCEGTDPHTFPRGFQHHMAQ